MNPDLFNARGGSNSRPSSMPPPMRGRGGRGRRQGIGRGRGQGMVRDGDLNGKPRSRRNSLEATVGRKTKFEFRDKVDPEVQYDDSNALNQSYDFAREEEEQERLRKEKREEEMRRMEEELERIEREEEEKRRKAEEEEMEKRQEEQERRQKEEERTLREAAEEEKRKLERQKAARMAKKAAWMSGQKEKQVVTWVGRHEGVGVRHVKRSLRELVNAARSVVPSDGHMYTICERYDTYQTGGLYPILHLSEDSGAVNKLMHSGSFLDPLALGENNHVDQGVFEEMGTVRPPLRAQSAENSVLVASAFKSIEVEPNPTLIKEWKQWTGARAFMQDIMMAGLQCLKIRFLVRAAPFEEEDPGGFMYILLTEVAINKPSDEGNIVDLVQRFRVERWSGYNTIYRQIN